MSLVVLIFGPRDLFPTNVTARFDHLFARFLGGKITIMHGDARGVDRAGRDFCRARGYVEEPHPYLKAYGKAGGPLRNTEQAEIVRLRGEFTAATGNDPPDPK